jgi:hypothetical protein
MCKCKEKQKDDDKEENKKVEENMRRNRTESMRIKRKINLSLCMPWQYEGVWKQRTTH